MKKTYGIVAHPVSHSLSPQMQSVAFAHHNLETEFLRFDIVPEELEEFIRRVRNENISGLAVSLPHKETIIPHLDSISETGKKIGAVNTVFWRDGLLCGDNTDAEGFWKSITNGNSKYKNAAVIGAGGASRAIVYILKKHGIDVTIFNRTAEKAQQLAHRFNASSKALSEFMGCNFGIVVNSTSVGLKEEKSPIPHDAWKGFTGTAFDAIFDPLQTKFLRNAQSYGSQVVTGEKMLLYQGIKQFKIWTGLDAPEEKMRNALEKALVTR